MQLAIKIGLIIVALSSILVAPVFAQKKEIGIYGIWTDKETYNQGETITIILELGWDFPASTDISPGVFDPVKEEYVSEDVYIVEGSGFNNVTLSFTAPSTDGIYEYQADVFYDDDGWVMSDTGYEEHTIYISVGSISNEYSAHVTDVDVPSTVSPGELFNVTVYVEVSFPTMTTFEIAISNPSTGEVILEFTNQTIGEQTGTYWFEIYAPDIEETYTLGADIVFETPDGWTFTEGGTQSFDFKVKKSGGGIPGFSLLSIVLGSILALGYILTKTNGAPIARQTYGD